MQQKQQQRPRFSNFRRSTGEREVRFDVDGVDLCVVNAIRRAIKGDVPTAAFAYDPRAPDAPNTGVHVLANTSALSNEFVAHRLSLLPVCFDENELDRVLADPRRHTFSLRVKNAEAGGSGNSSAVRLVTSKDIEVQDGLTGAPRPPEVRDALFPPDPVTGDHVLLLRLRPTATGAVADGEEFSATMTLSPGTGYSHARWSPECQCHFRNRQDPAAVAAALKAHLDSQQNDGGDKLQEQQFMTLHAHRHFVRDAYGDPCAFEFVVESACGLRPEYLVFKALEVLSRRVSALAKRVSALSAEAASASASASAAAAADPASSTSTTTVDACSNADDMYAFTVHGEGHTLGNLIHGLVYNRYIRGGDGGEGLQYIGYYEPHPLDRCIVFKLKVAPGVDVSSFFATALTDCVVAQVDAVNHEWVSASGLSDKGVHEVTAWTAKRRPPK